MWRDGSDPLNGCVVQSLQQKFMAESGRGAMGASPPAYYLPQRYMEPEVASAGLGAGYAGAPPASAPRQTSPPASSPRIHVEAAVLVSPVLVSHWLRTCNHSIEIVR